MSDRLIITNERQAPGFRIQWAFEDDDLGGYLCQNADDGKGDPPEDRDAWQHWAASKAVQAAPGYARDTISAFWETESQAKVALRLAKAALKQERPLPEWAQKALAEGWKPPKGWKA